MKLERYMNEDLLIKKSMEILMDNLGPIETTRFLNIYQDRERVEGVKRHREWQKTLNKDKFFDEIFGR